MIAENDMLGKIMKEGEFVPKIINNDLIVGGDYTNVIASSVILRTHIDDVVLGEYIKSDKDYKRLRKYIIYNINNINKILESSMKISTKNVKSLIYIREILIQLSNKQKLKILCQKLKGLKAMYNANHRYKTRAYNMMIMEQEFNLINNDVDEPIDALLIMIDNIQLKTIRE